MEPLKSIERRAIEHALVGSEPWQVKLLSQLVELRVTRREDTGVGFYTYFEPISEMAVVEIPEKFYSIPPQCIATHPDIKGDIIFLLWLENGCMDCLECASGAPSLPDNIEFVPG